MSPKFESRETVLKPISRSMMALAAGLGRAAMEGASGTPLL
jgi:hypothetical protein